MGIYRWKAGSHISSDANVAGSVMSELSKAGKLTPSELVKASKDESAPLHNEFEWNDGIAATKYREVQAGKLIRSIEVVIEQSDEPARAFMPVTVEKDHSYVPIQQVMRNPDYTNETLERAKRELLSFRRKYSQLEELANVFRAIDEFESKN